MRGSAARDYCLLASGYQHGKRRLCYHTHLPGQAGLRKTAHPNRDLTLEHGDDHSAALAIYVEPCSDRSHASGLATNNEGSFRVLGYVEQRLAVDKVNGTLLCC